MSNPLCRWFSWIPWVHCGPTNGHEAREARASSEKKLGEAQELGRRAQTVADSLAERIRENHFRIQMEQAFRGHQK